MKEAAVLSKTAGGEALSDSLSLNEEIVLSTAQLEGNKRELIDLKDGLESERPAVRKVETRYEKLEKSLQKSVLIEHGNVEAKYREMEKLRGDLQEKVGIIVGLEQTLAKTTSELKQEKANLQTKEYELADALKRLLQPNQGLPSGSYRVFC